MPTTEPNRTVNPVNPASDAYGERLALRLNYEELSKMAAKGFSDTEIAGRIGIRSRIVAGLKSYYGLAGRWRSKRSASDR